MKALSIQDVSMVFAVPGGEPVRALDHVSLDLQPGELMSVLGPSGWSRPGRAARPGWGEIQTTGISSMPRPGPDCFNDLRCIRRRSRP